MTLLTINPLAILRAVVLLSLFSITVQKPNCQSFKIMDMGKNIKNCKKLATLGAELGWNYKKSIGVENKTIIDVVFGAPSPGGWVAWGVNPGPRPEMIGTRALIGFHQQNGSAPAVATYNVTIDTQRGCNFEPFEPSEEVDFEVQNSSIRYFRESEFLVLSATVTLRDQMYNMSSLNHVWQVGPAVEEMVPQMHAMTLQNVDSLETINLYTGESQRPGPERQQLRKVHGILNIIGWGLLLPLGTIVARYAKEFPLKYRGWYCLHVTSHTLAYILGSIGWAIGLWLGNESRDSVFSTHRSLGIVIFTFTTLQMLALWLTPDNKDEYRKYWRMYHHLLGYTVIALVIVNIFQGIKIQRPDAHWKWKGAYLGILAVLSSVVIILEAFTWSKHIVIVLKRPQSLPTA